jgi:hypothetical protein
MNLLNVERRKTFKVEALIADFNYAVKAKHCGVTNQDMCRWCRCEPMEPRGRPDKAKTLLFIFGVFWTTERCNIHRS